MDMEEIEGRVGQEIRSCHPWAYRAGKWATIKAVVPCRDKEMWLLEWPDGETDIWAPEDNMARYEFRDDRDALVVLLRGEVDYQDLAEHLAEVLREAGYEKVESSEDPKGPAATLEGLEAAPLGTRAVTADDRVIKKTPEGWVFSGIISDLPLRSSSEIATSETAMNLSPLYLIGEHPW